MENNDSQFVRHTNCPFHDEKVPSLAIYSNGTYFCFACRAYGNIEDLDRSLLRTTKEQKLQQTAKRAKVKQLYTEIAKIANDSDYFDIEDITIELYKSLHSLLIKSERHKYFLGRKLTLDTIKYALLGWTGSRYSIPIFKSGKPYSISFRREDGVEDSFKYFNLSGTQTTIYNDIALKNKNIVITEGQIDCLSLHQFRIPTICSTTGALGFKSEWAKNELANKNIYVIMDNDRGGELARQLITEHFNGTCKHLYVPKKFNDVNEFLTKTDTISFKNYLRRAIRYATTKQNNEL